MAKKRRIGKARPGKVVTRRVSRGPGKGDTVLFKANSSKAREAGKLKPRVVVVDRGKKGTQKTLAKGKKAASKFRRGTRRRG